MFINPSTDYLPRADWRSHVVAYFGARGILVKAQEISLAKVALYGAKTVCAWIKGFGRPRFIPLGLVLEQKAAPSEMLQIATGWIKKKDPLDYSSAKDFFFAEYGGHSIDVILGDEQVNARLAAGEMWNASLGSLARFDHLQWSMLMGISEKDKPSAFESRQMRQKGEWCDYDLHMPLKRLAIASLIEWRKAHGVEGSKKQSKPQRSKGFGYWI